MLPAERDSRGILRPATGLAQFRLDRHEPPAALARFVQWFWVVTWDLQDQPAHRQETLPYPAVNVSIIDVEGTGQVNGVVKGRSIRVLEGAGQVVAALFRPAGFRPFVDGPVSRWNDQIVPAVDAFGERATEWERADERARGAEERVAALSEFLLALAPAVDPMTDLVNDAAERISADRSITRVDHLAALTGVGTRRLQRLFADHVGVSPKWAIRRSRLQEAIERVAHGERVRWAEVAAELGYADQAHLTRAFTATVGLPPERYARECAVRSQDTMSIAPRP